MAYIHTIPADEASGKLREIYDGDMEASGQITNSTRAMSLRPEVIDTWRQFLRSIRKNMRLRPYELVTIAAAAALECTYWMLAHGAVLRKHMFTAEQVEAIVTDFHNAGLEPGEVAMMDYAQKVIRKARDVTQEDIDELHTHGFSDAEILDITMTAAARSFFSKVLDAVGAEPDAEYMELEDSLREALTVGRPFGNGQ